MKTATVCVIALLFGCSEKAEKKPEAKPDPVAKADPAAVEGETKPTAIPPLSLEPVAAAAFKEAQKLNAEGLALQKAGKFAEAAAKYLEALAKDPGHILARYNLACAYNLAEKHPEALGVLKEFKDNGCALCIGRLVRARDDGDWESQWDEPAFKALTESAKVKTADVKQDAQYIQTGFGGNPETASGLLHHRKAVAVTIQAGDEEEKKSFVGLPGLKKFAKDLMTVEMKLTKCKKECCSFESKHGGDRSLGDQIHTVCFSKDSGGVRTLKSLGIANET